jgi:HEPN domain-containing protein
MSDLPRAEIYLNMASKDLRALWVMQEPDQIDIEIFGFHLQQTVEKSLKAWLCLLGSRFPNKHDLHELHALLRKTEEIYPEEFLPLLRFTDFATTFRYDSYPGLDMTIDRRAMTVLAGKLIEFVRQKMLQQPTPPCSS